VLGKLMARRPEDRFQTAAEAAEALRALAGQEAGVRPAPAASPERSVPGLAASPGRSPTGGTSAPEAGDLPGPVPATRSDRARSGAARRPAFALFILLLELAVFGLGVALGHVLAIRGR
jgi:hypothetical protein